MIKNWRFSFAFTFMCTQIGIPTAYALIMEINPVVLINAAAPTQKQNGGSLGWTGEVATGFGFLTSYSLFDSPFDLETGAVYMNQTSTRDNAGTAIKLETHHLHIPLLFRFNFDEKMGLGIGGYAGFAQGSIPTGTHDRDFGLLFSARASLQIIPQLHFIVDGRYQHGLSNLSNIPPGLTGDFLNTRSMQAYLGLSYRFIPF